MPITNVAAVPQNQCFESWIPESRFIPNIPTTIAPTAAVDVTMDTANSIWSKWLPAESSRNITFDIKYVAKEKMRYAKTKTELPETTFQYRQIEHTHTQNIAGQRFLPKAS